MRKSLILLMALAGCAKFTAGCSTGLQVSANVVGEVRTVLTGAATVAKTVETASGEALKLLPTAPTNSVSVTVTK